ncbi:TPA: phosphotransferase [Pseudomonas aeruginosa]
MLVRLPSAAHYAGQVEKEQEWLPKLAPFLPNKIPVPLGMGTPGENYPWKWSIYRWIEGKTVASFPGVDLCVLSPNLFAARAPWSTSTSPSALASEWTTFSGAGGRTPNRVSTAAT